jgi:predicted nucleic acid-binding protein
MNNSILLDTNILIYAIYPNPMTFKIFQDLIQKYNPRGLWIHDVEIASIGIAYGISTIATNNISDFGRITIDIKQI